MKKDTRQPDFLLAKKHYCRKRAFTSGKQSLGIFLKLCPHVYLAIHYFSMMIVLIQFIG